MSITEYLNKLLGGCGVEDRKLELQGLLYQISEEYHSGNLSDDDLSKLVKDLCESIVVITRRCNKSYSVDACINDVTNVIKSTIPRSLLRTVGSRLRKIGRRKRKSSGEISLL